MCLLTSSVPKRCLLSNATFEMKGGSFFYPFHMYYFKSVSLCHVYKRLFIPRLVFSKHAGSPEERKAVHRAFRYSSRKEHRVYNVDAPDVSFDLQCPEDVSIGNDFEIKVCLSGFILSIM